MLFGGKIVVILGRSYLYICLLYEPCVHGCASLGAFHQLFSYQIKKGVMYRHIASVNTMDMCRNASPLVVLRHVCSHFWSDIG